MLKNWEESESRFWQILLLTTLLVILPMAYYFSSKGLLFYLLGVAIFAVEFRFIIWATGLLVGTIKANFSAMAAIFIGKLASWMALASAPFWLPTGMGSPFAAGVGVFVVALLVFVLATGGLPRLQKNE